MNPRNGNGAAHPAIAPHAASRSPTRPPWRPWVLGVRAHDSLLRQVPLAEGTVILGAGQGCSVVLRGRDVAREHAKLQLSSERARLSVFPHAAPALLNGVQVREAGLEPGDTIQVGDVQLTLHRADLAVPIAAGEVAMDEPAARHAAGNGSARHAARNGAADRAQPDGAALDRS